MRSARSLIGLAAAVGVLLAGLVLADRDTPVTLAATEAPAFAATFDTPADFYDRFDYGYSGLNPNADPNAIRAFHGDHDDSCAGPDTGRTVSFGGTSSSLDYSQLFWHCAPGNDPAKGHVMTGVDTVSYNIAWFSPKPAFTGITRVCWDQNLTTMSKRKWTQVVFVTGADQTRFPAGVRTGADSEARGSGGFDLGYTSPEFRGGDSQPTTRIEPQTPGFAGLKIQDAGKASWFRLNDFTAQFEGSEVRTTDKATRYRHCLEQVGANTVRFTQARPGGNQVLDLPGQIPQGATRVVFQDDNYDPPKDDQYRSTVLTWHWDNVQVFTGSGPAPTSSTSSTSAPTTTVPPTTATTVAPTTTVPPTSTTVAPTTTSTTRPAPVPFFDETDANGDRLIGYERPVSVPTPSGCRRLADSRYITFVCPS